jgi:hypothetical protein
MSRAVALAVAAGLLAAATAGCGAGTSGHDAAARGAARGGAPVTAWQRTLNEIRPDGSVSTSTALAAFALAIGPVPGARATSGPAQAIASGTLAVQWVLAHWSALTPRQRDAVLADLGVPGAKTEVTSLIRPAAAGAAAKTAGGPDIPCLTADAGAAGPYRAQVAGIESDIASHMGDGPFPPDVYIAVNTRQLKAASKMYTHGCQGTTAVSSGPVSGCTIHVNPVVSAGNFPAGDVHDFLIHELTHCYLFVKLGGAYGQMPSWYVEGAPMWAMSALGNGSGLESSYWTAYLDTPDAPLFSRAYTAIGYFAHLAETGTDVWHRLIPMGEALLTGGNDAGWNAAHPTTDFLGSWGPGFAAGRYPGSAWQTGGPNLPAYQGPVPQQSVADGQTVTVSAPAAATGISHVDLDAQVVQFVGSAGASGRISLDGGSDATLDQAAGTAYATGSQATCPAGSPDAGASLTPISSGQHYVGVTGGLQAASVRVEGTSLASFCAHKNTANCVVGNWTTTEVRVTLPGEFTEAGGAGVTMHISADGSTVIDFGPMSPIDVDAKTFTAHYVFGGQASGQLVLSKGGSAGTWFALSPASGGKLDYSSLTATVHVTSPASIAIGPLSISALAGQMGAGASSVSSTPAGEGTWTCSGNTLINRGPASLPSYGTWTWTRTG